MIPEVTTFIDNAAKNHQMILNQLRTLILSIDPQINEQLKWNRPVYTLKKDFCYLKTTKKHVTIGFFDFEKITTNTHLIEGTGKSMRHVKINELNEITDFKIREMINEVLAS